MLYEHLDSEKIDNYKKSLKIIGSLSNLFSDAPSPYLYYRIAERCYCDALNAKDCSRSDVSFDAVLNDVGIGLKTFLHNNGDTYQKVAEFNQLRKNFEVLDDQDLVKYISNARNQRLDTTLNQYGVGKMIYHLVTRKPNQFNIYETEMSKINLSKINLFNASSSTNTIHFKDGKNTYSFNKGKSTLFKKFMLREASPVDKIDIEILEDPLYELKKLGDKTKPKLINPKHQVVLPLYVTKTSGKYMAGDVQHASGLNQAFAKGRTRHENEVYIPVPKVIHQVFPGFLPNNKNDIFDLRLPNKSTLKAKMCQFDCKGLMSNPNKDLGKWLLREVLKVPSGNMVTREILNMRGIDCVIVSKISTDAYEIDFGGLGKFEEFRQEYLD